MAARRHRRRRRSRRGRGFREYAGAALLIMSVAIAAAWLEKQNEVELSGAFAVIDGDSLRLDGDDIRLKGIDAPELDQSCQRGNGDWPCGRESKQHLKSLISGQNGLSCRGSSLDKYDRLLAICEIGGADINAAMVRDGFAIAFGGYEQEERQAMAEAKGIWAGAFDRPSLWRQRRQDQFAAEEPHRDSWLAAILGSVRSLTGGQNP